MPVLVITQSDMMQPAMPLALQPFLGVGQWQAIRSSVLSAVNTAQSTTCLVEWGICCFFAFPCIFCCHQCLYESVLSSQWQQEPRKLNGAIFGGAPVLGVVGMNMSINTDYLQGNNVVLMHGGQPNNVIYQSQPGQTVVYSAPVGQQAPIYAQPQAQPQYAQPEPVMATAVPISYGNDGAYAKGQQMPQPVMAAPVPVPVPAPVAQRSPNTMTVTLPANAHAGQILTVASPTGAMVQVTVQAHHRPGEMVMVAY